MNPYSTKLLPNERISTLELWKWSLGSHYHTPKTRLLDPLWSHPLARGLAIGLFMWSWQRPLKFQHLHWPYICCPVSTSNFWITVSMPSSHPAIAHRCHSRHRPSLQASEGFSPKTPPPQRGELGGLADWRRSLGETARRAPETGA